MANRSHLVVLKLAEELYAEASAQAYSDAEESASRHNAYPVAYPQPFDAIGCGYGALGEHVRRQCIEVAAQLGLDYDICHQTELLVTLFCGRQSDYTRFSGILADRLLPVKPWVINGAELWRDNADAPCNVS